MDFVRPRSVSPASLLLAGVLSILVASVLMPTISYPLVAAGCVVLGTTLVLILQPTWLWCLLLAALPFSVEIENILGHGNNLTIPTEPLVPLAGLALLVRMLKDGKVRWRPSFLHLAILVFFLIQWTTLMFSPLPTVTLKALVRTTSYVLCGYLLTQVAVRRFDDLKPLFLLVGLGTVMLVIYGFYTQFVEGISIYQDIAHPFFENHCIYAAWVCFPAAFALAALSHTVPQRGVWIAMLVLFLAAVLLSFVRGAWLGLLALMAYLAYRRGFSINLRMVAAILFLAILGIVLVVALDLTHLFADRWTNLFDRRYVTNESRIDRWMAALSMWWSHPLLGVGVGCYPDLYPQFVYFLDAFERTIRMGAHSIYFEILAETGIFGLAAYLAIIAAFFHETRRHYRISTGRPPLQSVAIGLEGMMVVYLVHALVNNLGPSDKIDIAFWTTCGLAVRLRHLAQGDPSDGKAG